MESSARLQIGIQAANGRTEFQSRVAAELWLNIAGKDFRLVGKTIRIGRSPENDIVIDDKSVSRYHALLTLAPNKVILEDLKSRNGVRVNGAAIRRSELKDNDRVRIGDMDGLFYQRVKASAGKQAGAIFSRISEQLSVLGLTTMVEKVQARAAVEKFQQLEPKKKIIFVAAGVIAVMFLMNAFSSSKSASNPIAAPASSSEQVVDKPIDRRAFEKCLEAEDLGNFRQATACLKVLPLTVEVQESLERVKRQQEELSQRRYEEGVKAFENYYYDIAIQKWQEVLLVADDASKFRFDAVRGIQSAEERKKLR